MTTLLGVRHLVLDLQAAGASKDQFLGQQVGCVLVAEVGIDVGNDRHNMALERIDAVDDFIQRRLIRA